MRLRFKFWIEENGELVLSDWRVRLLQTIAETGSVSAAAARYHMSYRRAWGKIKEMEQRLGIQLVESQRGGPGGGTTALTPKAQELVQHYLKFKDGLNELIEQRFRETFGPET